MNKERVEYFSSNDVLYGHNLSKIEEMPIPLFENISINDAIEFFEIKRYFDEGTRYKTWTEQDFEKYKEKSDRLDGLTKRFFSQINDESINELYENIELGYHSQFWILFDICKLYNKISEEVFASLIEHEHVSPHDLFKHYHIAKKYGNVLRNYILNNDFCVPLVLHIYEQDFTDDEKMYLPAELTGEDICNYLETYVDGEKPNPNYLETILNMHCTKTFPITDELRLKAKKKYESEIERISQSATGVLYGISVSFDPNQEEPKACKSEGRDISVSYSTHWLQDSLDYESILNNFIYVFEFVDFPQMRSSHVCKKSNSSVFERAFAPKSSRYYHINQQFNALQAISAMQMSGYYDFLKENEINLEDVLLWFFTQYLQSEFNCPEIRVSMPSLGSSYAEKCSSIITAIETILRQYNLFAKNGCIDFELISMSTTPVVFDGVKSIVDNKYVYGNGKDYENLSFMLFSDQCMFSFVERIYKQGRSYDSFIDLLLKEEIFLSDYREREKESFEYMASFDLVSIDKNGKIEPKNKIKLAILRDLYQNDVISKKHYPSDAQKVIDEFIEKGILIEKSSFFSQPETDYLNYLLNRSEYNNGLEIRNKYIHGIQHVNQNETEHKQNYYILLRILILIAIKINDEFCLKEINEE